MATRKVPPPIERGKTYTVSWLRENYFQGKRAWLAARKNGLDQHLYYIGRVGMIDGDDLVDSLKQQGKKRPAAANS